MTKTFRAIYQNGALRPLDPLDLPNEKEVLVEIREVESSVPNRVLQVWTSLLDGMGENDRTELEGIFLDRSNFGRSLPPH